MSARRKRNGNTFKLLIALLIAGAIAVAYMPAGKADKDTTADDAQTQFSEKYNPEDKNIQKPAAAEPAIPSFSELEKVKIPATTDNQMLNYRGFTVAFNPGKHQPNYTVWTLEPGETDGPYSRKDVNFMPDDNIAGCATLADYRNSGFDRGHMAPAADMKWSKQAMADCHLLTNMCPQDNRLNAGAWATVEKNARKWALKHGPLVIVAGPVLNDRLTRTIGTSEIPVPERFFKVILAPQAQPPIGIAFVMPNSYVEGGAQATVTTIDEVEAITGFDFFAALPDDIETTVEQQNSLRKWNK